MYILGVYAWRLLADYILLMLFPNDARCTPPLCVIHATHGVNCPVLPSHTLFMFRDM